MLNFKEDVKVDRYRLDEDWQEHPALYAEYASAWADAYQERERAAERLKLEKERLDDTYNRLDGEIRADWAGFGFTKAPTEAAIKSCIQKHPDYLAQRERVAQRREELVEAQATEARLSVALKAFDHRKTVLESLTKLMLGGYYSKPHIDTEAQTQATEKKTAEQQKRLHRRLTKKNTKEGK